VRVNVLTIDETDPKSGTAEFKACAVRVEPIKATTQRLGAAALLQPIAAQGDD